MTAAPHPPSLPRKLATLLFSGGLAVLAVTRAGLASCDVAAPPPRAITPSGEEFTTPQPHTPAPPIVPEELPDDYFGGAKSDAEAWPAPSKPAIAIVTPEAPIDPPPRPDAWFYLYTRDRRIADLPEEALAPIRYFGGVKSDPEAWIPNPRKPAELIPMPGRYFGGAKSDADVWGDVWADLPGPNGSESYNEFIERTARRPRAKRGDP